MNAEQKKLERNCQEGLNVIAIMSKEGKFQAQYVKEANFSVMKMEEQLITLTGR